MRFTEILNQIKDKSIQYKGTIFSALGIIIYIILFIYFSMNVKDLMKWTRIFDILFILILSGALYGMFLFYQKEGYNSSFSKTFQSSKLFFYMFLLLFGVILSISFLISSNIASLFLYVTINTLIISMIMYGIYRYLKASNLWKYVKPSVLLIYLDELWKFIKSKFVKPTIKKPTETYNKLFWGLLIGQIIFLVAYFGIPLLLKHLLSNYGTTLLSLPVNLNQRKNIGTFENLHKKSKKPKFNYQYGLSAWFFLHNQGPNKNASYSEDTEILNYGNKPRITYNAKDKMLKVYMQQGKGLVLLQKQYIEEQKWNNIVVNYHGGIFDVFLNGTLILTKKSVVPYMSYDTVSIGEDDGLSGGIGNVIYFHSPFPNWLIHLNYYLLKDKNPPVHFS